MKPERRRFRLRRIGLPVSVALVFAMLLGGGVTGVTEAAPAAYRGGLVVAMGDSRASGAFHNGTVDEELGCRRSAGTPARRAAARLGARNFQNVACGGAHSKNIWREIQFTGRIPNPVQLDQVPRNARVIVVSTGSNDLNWTGTQYKCINKSGSTRDRKCRDRKRTKRKAAQRLAVMRKETRAAMRAIRRQHPNAQIVLIGPGGHYAGRSCAKRLPMGTADAVFMTNVFERANRIQRRIARSVGARYVDVQRHAADHGVCAPGGQNWFSGAVATGNNIPWHMNRRGAREIGVLVAKAVRR